MATGDMLARLLLDSSGFEKNIKKSKKETDNFKNAGAAMGKEVASQLKKIAVAAIGINSATEAFKAFVNSSQTLGDKFRRNVDGMKTVIDNFVYAIANADFSSFSGGLEEMFARGKTAYDARDQYGNTLMSAQYKAAKYAPEFREALAKSRNPNLSFNERQKALNEARKKADKLIEGQDVQASDAYKTIRAEIEAKTAVAAKNIAIEFIESALELDSSYNRDQVKADVKARYDALVAANEKRIAETQKKYTRVDQNMVSSLQGGGAPTVVRLKGYTEAMAAAQQANYDALQANAELVTTYKLLFRDDDTVLKLAYETLQAAHAAKNQIVEFNTALAEAERLLAKERKAGQQAAQKRAKEEAEAARLAGMVAANPAELTLVAPTWAAPPTGAQMKGSLPRGKSLLTGESSIGMIDANKLSQDTFDWALMKDAEKQAKVFEDMNSIVGELASGFAALGDSIGGTTGQIFTFIGSIAEAAQQILPLISLIMAETVAHNTNASAATADAAAKTLSANAGIPGVGVALGVAGVAAIIAAMASIPKFAEGGIVNRATLGVFGEAGPEAVMPLDKLEEYITPREMRVTGNIKASGKDLVVVLDNYNRVRNG